MIFFNNVKFFCRFSVTPQIDGLPLVKGSSSLIFPDLSIFKNLKVGRKGGSGQGSFDLADEIVRKGLGNPGLDPTAGLGLSF
jgi:hypothetical protein